MSAVRRWANRAGGWLVAWAHRLPVRGELARPPEVPVECGRLRRDGEGNWYFGVVCIGRDCDPYGFGMLEESAEYVAVELADALTRVVEVYGDYGVTSHGLEALLLRYSRWRRGKDWFDGR